MRGKLYANYLNRYNGMTEAGGYNRGEFINRANNRYAYTGAPYCASGQSLAMDEYNLAQKDVALKLNFAVRSARAKDFVTKQSIDAKLVYYGKVPVPDDSFVMYTRTGGGHISYNSGGNQFHFNSSPPNALGSQWDGKWSGWKHEQLQKQCSPLRAFRIVAFTPLT